MGRRSPKLEGRRDEVVALFKYLKQQSGMTLLQLENKFTPREDSKKVDGNDDYKGRQWSRWINGKIQPEINLVRKVYHHVTENLISGNWKENGNEALWASLLSAVIDPKLAFMLEKKSTLLKILEQLDEGLVGEKLLRAISAGYYIPSEAEIRKIFWSKTDKYAEEGGDGLRIIYPPEEDEAVDMQILMTDILVNFGCLNDNNGELEFEEFARFASKNGFVGQDPILWTNQMLGQIKLDVQSLSEIAWRAKHLYPRDFGYDNKLSANKHTFDIKKILKIQDELVIVSRKLQDYEKFLGSHNKASLTFGVIEQLSYEYFMSSGAHTRFGWNFPTVSIW